MDLKQASNPALAVAAWAAANPLPTGIVSRGRVKSNDKYATKSRLHGFRPNGGVCNIHIQLPEICGAERLCICISGAGAGCCMDKGRRWRKSSN